MNGGEVSVVPTGYGLYLIQTVLALGAVCLLGYVVLRYGAKRLYGAGPRPGRVLTLVERLPLDPRRSVYLVDVAGRRVLLGTSDQGGVTFLTEVDPSPDPLPAGEGPGEGPDEGGE
jgi:flagellar protein FliO/FliZ